MRGSMRRIVASLIVVAALRITVAEPAHADSSTDAALALGAFAVLNQVVTGQTIFHRGLGHREVVRETVIVREPPAVVYAPPPPPRVVYAPPPVIVYPQHDVYSYHYGPKHYYKHSKKYWKHYRKHHHHDDDD